MGALKWSLIGILTLCACAPIPIWVGQKNRVSSHYKGTPLTPPRSAILASNKVTQVARAASYTVKPGDNMWRISLAHGTTVLAMQQLNNISDPTAIRVGMVLRLPQTNSATSQPLKPYKSSSPGSSKRYAFTWPVSGKITSRFGQRWGRAHDGIDIGAPLGRPVRAVADGEVLFSAPHGSYGNLVVLKHEPDMVTVYAHQSVNLVRKGQRVHVGQIIGKIGQTGRATGPHLHFEVRRGTKPQNPLQFLPP